MYWGRCIGECTGVVVLSNVLGSLYWGRLVMYWGRCIGECTGVVVLFLCTGVVYWYYLMI